jgi:hypothetical protein
MAKKIGVFLLVLCFLMLSISLISASLEITKSPVSVSAIPSINKPAIFTLNIKNLGTSDSFSAYSLASVNIYPNSSVFIGAGETKDITISIFPTFPLKISPDYYSFEYKIKGDQTPPQSDEIAITLLAPKDAFDLIFEDITPDSKSAVLHFKNKYGGPFEKISAEFSSPLFSYSQEFALSANEDKTIEIPLDSEKISSLLAGQYIVAVKLNIENFEAEKNTVINFNERSGIAVSELREGKILQRYEIEKKNNGNLKAEVTIAVRKNLFSALFTSFNVVPAKKEISGFGINHVFKKELSPGESLRVVVKTNWWILVGVIIAIIIIYYLIDKYLKNKLVLKKRVSLVRTKGGEFALKVTITAKARDFVERIRIIDRIPPMVKIFERYGMSMPEKIDESNRRAEWNIQALSAGEERIMSYIVYSKIGVMGRFELPATEAIYEFQGKIREAQSNRAFYTNETRSS